MSKIRGLGVAEYLVFRKEWYAGAYPHERLGQAFLNRFFREVVHPELFHESDPMKADGIIWSKYLEL